ncbi:MAG: Rid family detoxifying hydrolase [Pseudomonadota bacterium]
MFERLPIESKKAPSAVGAYTQAVRYGDVIYISGQLPLDANRQLVGDTPEAQMRQVFKNIAEICSVAGGNLSSIAKLNVYLKDLANISVLNKVMVEMFAQPYPARTTVGVAIPMNAEIEVDAILHIG